MAASTSRSKKKKSTRWSDGHDPGRELGPSEQLAHQIVLEFGDLAPSVERIMDSDLDDDARHKALTSFHASLGTLGDPNRDPRVAIANARSGSAGSGAL